MRKLCLLVALALALCASAGAQNTSLYTSTSTKACKTLESHASEAGWYRGRCKGVAGYTLELTEGDLRQSLTVITPGKKRFDLNFTSYYPSFSSVGDKVEWRMKKGVPVALIARYSVADPEDSTKQASYLMIVSVSKTNACVTDVIRPQAIQNQLARKAADAASTQPCKASAQ